MERCENSSIICMAKSYNAGYLGLDSDNALSKEAKVKVVSIGRSISINSISGNINDIRKILI